MNKKPMYKREIGVYVAIETLGQIVFVATSDAMGDLAGFGLIKPALGYPDGTMQLTVDPRFDFNEVVNYMRTYSD